MADQPNKTGILPEQLAQVLSVASGSEITPEMLAADLEAGAPVNPDGSLNLICYVAWLLKQDGNART